MDCTQALFVLALRSFVSSCSLADATVAPGTQGWTSSLSYTTSWTGRRSGTRSKRSQASWQPALGASFCPPSLPSPKGTRNRGGRDADTAMGSANRTRKLLAKHRTALLKSA